MAIQRTCSKEWVRSSSDYGEQFAFVASHFVSLGLASTGLLVTVTRLCLRPSPIQARQASRICFSAAFACGARFYVMEIRKGSDLRGINGGCFGEMFTTRGISLTRQARPAVNGGRQLVPRHLMLGIHGLSHCVRGYRTRWSGHMQEAGMGPQQAILCQVFGARLPDNNADHPWSFPCPSEPL